MSTTEVWLDQIEDYRFRLHFSAPGSNSTDEASTPERMQAWIVDEPAPLGSGQGPSPGQLLLAAVANCLSDSLLFALRKFKQKAEPIRTVASQTTGRNPEGRLRVTGIRVTLHLGAAAAELEHLERILGQFELYCTVSQSVGQAIPIAVAVFDAQGQQLSGTLDRE